MKPITIYSMLIVVIASSIYGCGKQNRHIAREISWVGVQEAGSTIIFKCDAPKADSYQWNFGDSTTSTDEQPHHIFSKPGKFSISLVTNGKANKAITDSIVIGPKDMNKIGGTRVWHHTYNYGMPWPPYRGVLVEPDESFEIKIADLLRVVVKGDTLSWLSSTDSVLSFHKKLDYYRGEWLLHFNHFTGAAQLSIRARISAGAGDGVHYYNTP